MITDPQRIRRQDLGHPDICNVCSYYKLFRPDLVPLVYNQCSSAQIGCIDNKKRLAEILIDYLAPIQKKRKIYLGDKKQLAKILNEGAKKASSIASETMEQVKKAVGLI